MHILCRRLPLFLFCSATSEVQAAVYGSFSRHACSQGAYDMGMSRRFLPGYIPVPCAAGELSDSTLRAYYKNQVLSSNDAMSVNKWKNIDKFLVSLLSSWFGESARDANEFCFDWLPKVDVSKKESVALSSVRGAVVLGAGAGRGLFVRPQRGFTS